MAFVPRLTRPEAGNKYYIRKASGGYSNAIKGKPTDKDCDVLSNCVGYAYGRFNEIGGYGYCKYLAPVNAENFMQYRGSCKIGQTPKLGAVMVWQKGATLSNSDGAGHVAIVEKIISDTEVVTSESGYGSKPFWTQTRKKGSNGNWGAGSAYKFLGFIYNPAVSDEDCTASGGASGGAAESTTKEGNTVKIELPVLKKGSTGGHVKLLQRQLIAMGYKMTSESGKTTYGADGSFGGATHRAVVKLQTAFGKEPDGIVGLETWPIVLRGGK